MNRCMPRESVECSGAKMEVFKELTNLGMKDKADVKQVVT